MNKASKHSQSGTQRLTIRSLTPTPDDMVTSQPTPQAPSSLSAAPLSPPAPGPRRHPMPWLLAAVGAVAVLGAGGYVWKLRTSQTAVPQGAAAHWQDAQIAMQRHDYVRARQELTACLTAWPLYAEANYLMARVCRQLKDYPAWDEYLGRASQLQWPRDQLGLEESLEEAQLGDLTPVEQHLRMYADQRPEQASLVFEALAEGYLADRRYRELWELAATWTTLIPDDWLGWRYRGDAFYLEGGADKAVAEYKKALERAPDPRLVRLYLASAEIDTGHHQNALEIYQQAVTEHPDDPTALFGVAICQNALGHEAETRAALKELLRVQPNHVSGLLLQGKLDVDAGQARQAVAVLRKAAKLAPWRHDILHNLAEALQDAGDKAGAARCRDQLQKVTTTQREIDRLKRILHPNPRDVTARFQIAELEHKLGNDQEAVQWYTGVLAIDPTHAASRRALAEYARRNKQESEDRAAPGATMRAD